METGTRRVLTSEHVSFKEHPSVVGHINVNNTDKCHHYQYWISPTGIISKMFFVNDSDLFVKFVSFNLQYEIISWYVLYQNQCLNTMPVIVTLWQPCGNRRLRWVSFVCSQWWGGTSQPADGGERSSSWGVWPDLCLEEDGYSSFDGLEGQQHCLKPDATGSQWRSWRRRVTWENLGRFYVTNLLATQDVWCSHLVQVERHCLTVASQYSTL